MILKIDISHLHRIVILKQLLTLPLILKPFLEVHSCGTLNPGLFPLPQSSFSSAHLKVTLDLIVGICVVY